MKLAKVTLYPCSGQIGFRPINHSYSVDEWYDNNSILERRHNVAYYDSPEAAEAHYFSLLGSVRRVDYDRSGDNCDDGGIQDPNFIVTNSHGYCPTCRAYMREQSICRRMSEKGVDRAESERLKAQLEAAVEQAISRVRSTD